MRKKGEERGGSTLRKKNNTIGELQYTDKIWILNKSGTSFFRETEKPVGAPPTTEKLVKANKNA